jgi:hypothetical protein
MTVKGAFSSIKLDLPSNAIAGRTRSTKLSRNHNLPIQNQQGPSLLGPDRALIPHGLTSEPRPIRFAIWGMP